MQNLRLSLRFSFQFCALLSLLFVEYQFGVPLLTSIIFVLWFSGQTWLTRFVMSLCFSLALVLIFSYSWLGSLGFLLASLWLARTAFARGWPQVLVGLLLGLVIAGGVVLFSQPSVLLIWQIVAALLTISLFSKTSRQQLRQLWRQRGSLGTKL
ncbi:MAG: hypothetical protein O2840_02545 [bacterium]|nr:hypothetical protein [bacterium]